MESTRNKNAVTSATTFSGRSGKGCLCAKTLRYSSSERNPSTEVVKTARNSGSLESAVKKWRMSVAEVKKLPARSRANALMKRSVVVTAVSFWHVLSLLYTDRAAATKIFVLFLLFRAIFLRRTSFGSEKTPNGLTDLPICGKVFVAKATKARKEK